MRIAFHAPFKPLDHPTPSGDRTIGEGLYRFLESRGEQLTVVSRLRTRDLCGRPWLWPRVLLERWLALRACRRSRAELFLSYHVYWKAPDLIGPWCARRLGLPYVIFQAAYSTKRRKDPRGWLGYHLNRHALLAAEHVFVNRRLDQANLLRLLPEERVSYVTPGIFPEQFAFDAAARRELRTMWGARGRPVILAAAMMRSDVKSQGLEFLLRALAPLAARRDFLAVLVGEGPEQGRLMELADALMPGRVHFPGLIPRSEMSRIYSAADVFAFPGIRESLGMVFLEAQSCGLPVVAFADGGIPEVVEQGVTGYLTPVHDPAAYAAAVERLLADEPRREKMGRAAAKRVRERHDLNRNYLQVESRLAEVLRDHRLRRAMGGGLPWRAPADS